MNEFKQYRRKELAELRPYVQLEGLSPIVSISEEDRRNGSPKLGDMIARNPKNYGDQWLVAAQYFADNFEPVEPGPKSETGAPIPRYMPKDRNSRLFRLIEELGELQAAIGKSGRWGMESYNPELPVEKQETNAQWIKREMADVRHALDAVQPDIEAHITAVDDKKRQEAPYGFCPTCGRMGVTRERRPNGNDKCEAGHVYPSASALPF